MATDTIDTPTTPTTSAGMPSIPAAHHALDTASNQVDNFGDKAQKIQADVSGKVRSIADEGKAQITQTLDGLVAAARDVAEKLESNGAGPFAKYAHQAADAVQGWSTTVHDKSLEDLVDDTRTLVRTSPAIAVGIALVAGIAVSRFLKATTPSHGY